jgi:hypothetical protein
VGEDTDAVDFAKKFNKGREKADGYRLLADSCFILKVSFIPK